jgi:hypothetical protein
LGYTWRLRSITETNLAGITNRLVAISMDQRILDEIVAKERAVRDKSGQLLRLVQLRTRWLDMIGDVRSSLLDGMWLTHIEPVGESENGPITRLSIKGMGFLDKVKDELAIGQFATALGKTKYFSATNKVEQTNAREFVLEFNVTANLKEPLTF